MKKILPIVLLVLMAIAAIALKRCNSHDAKLPVPTPRQSNPKPTTNGATVQQDDNLKLDRNAAEFYFTKHARCRMKCRQITQQEIKDILINGTVNYNKSNLQDPRGATYALEGYTKDKQHVRVIFAPKQSHLTVVTVIDIDEEHDCSCP